VRCAKEGCEGGRTRVYEASPMLVDSGARPRTATVLRRSNREDFLQFCLRRSPSVSSPCWWLDVIGARDQGASSSA
jgi:hypothetical protein